MSGCVVVVKNRVLRTAQIQSLSPNVLLLSEKLQSVAAEELSNESLVLEKEFSMDNTADVEENDQHVLDQAALLPCLLWSGR